MSHPIHSPLNSAEANLAISRKLFVAALVLVVLGFLALSVDMAVVYPFVTKSPGPIWEANAGKKGDTIPPTAGHVPHVTPTRASPPFFIALPTLSGGAVSGKTFQNYRRWNGEKGDGGMMNRRGLRLLGLVILVVMACTSGMAAAGDWTTTVRNGGDQPAVAYNPLKKHFLVAFHDEGAGDAVMVRRVKYKAGAAVKIDASSRQIGTAKDPDVAVAFSPTSNLYLAVWDTDDGSVPDPHEGDLMGAVLTEKGKPVGKTFRIDTDDNCTPHDPTVAHNSKNDNWLVVWRCYSGKLWGRVVNPDKSFGGAVVEIDSREGNRHPALAYNSTDNSYLLVVEYDGGPKRRILSRLLKRTGRKLSGREIISKKGKHPDLAYNPMDNDWLVGWGDHSCTKSGFAGDRCARARLVHGDGSLDDSV